MNKIMIICLLSFSLSAFAEVQNVDCTENANQIAGALAASTPNAVVLGAAKTSLILTIKSTELDGTPVVRTKDLDPNHPSRSYYVTIAFPIPGSDGQGGRARETRQFRIAYNDGAYSSADTAALFQQSCYLSGVIQINLIH